MSIGTKFVKKANLWLFYKCFNKSKLTDVFEWFDTEEQAEVRFVQEK